MIEVELTFEEWLEAAFEGCKRQIDGLIRGRTPRQGAPARQLVDGYFWNCNGTAGEKCVAKWLGVPWSGCFGDLKAADVANLEVRTRSAHHYDLNLYDHDKDDRVFILVTGTGPRWRIQGFIVARRGKNPAWKHAEPGGKPSGMNPAYWVPQRELNDDLELLKRRFLAHYKGSRVEHAPSPS